MKPDENNFRVTWCRRKVRSHSSHWTSYSLLPLHKEWVSERRSGRPKLSSIWLNV